MMKTFLQNIRQWWGPDKLFWHEYVLLQPTRLVDDTIGSGPVMRRRMNGVWHYRQMDAEERADMLAAPDASPISVQKLAHEENNARAPLAKLRFE